MRLGAFAFPGSGSRPTGAPREVTRDALDVPGERRLPSAVPSFFEACGRLATETAARGDFERARGLIEKAARVATLRDEVA